MIKLINESFYENLRDELVMSIYYALSDKGIYAEVWDEESHNSADFILKVQIDNGDWKHEHLRADNIIFDTIVEKYPDVEVEKIDEETTNSDSSDTYSSIHIFNVYDNESVVEGLKKSLMKENSGSYGVEIDNSLVFDDVRNGMNLRPRYFVMLKKYPKLGNDAYIFTYVDDYFDKHGYCFCTRNGELIDKDSRGLPLYNCVGADNILQKIFPKNFTPNELYVVWTDGPSKVQFATVSPMWSHISKYFK